MSVTLQTLSARPQVPLAQKPFHQWIFPDGTEWTLFFLTWRISRYHAMAEQQLLGPFLACRRALWSTFT